MKCNKPITININASYQNRPPIYKKVRCGKCKACRITKVREWSVRMLFEYATFKGEGAFATLTYDDENLPLWDVEHIKRIDGKLETVATSKIPTLNHKDIQDFIKRLRKRYNKSWQKFKYFCVGEYGNETMRPHYHIIFFGNIPFYESEISDTWKHGRVKIGSVTTASIRYVCKYMMKGIDKSILFGKDQYMVCSKGLGEAGIAYNYEKIAEDGYIIDQEGCKCPIPKYFRDRYPETFKGDFNEDLAINHNYNIGIPIRDCELDWKNATSEQQAQFVICQQIEEQKMAQKEANLIAKETVDKKRFGDNNKL